MEAETKTKKQSPNYREWDANKLRYVLKSTRKQIDKFENAIVKANKQLSELMKKRAEYRQKETLLRKELDLKFLIPNEETRKALENDEAVGRFSTHEEFEKSLESDQ